MSTWRFTVQGGDFKAGSGTCSDGWRSTKLHLPRRTRAGLWNALFSTGTTYRAADVEDVVAAADYEVEEGMTIGGAARLGYVLSGKTRKRKRVTFVIVFADGRSAACVSDPERFAKLKSLAPVRRRRRR